MKKLLLSLSFLTIGFVQGQTNVFSFGFDGITDDMLSAGWQETNQSNPLGTSTWTIASFTTPLTGAIFGSGNTTTVPVGQAGGDNSFALVNFNSTTGTGTISNWLITPEITVENGDVVTFYSRKGTDGTTDYPDRLELRMSSSTLVVPSGGITDVGSFNTLCTSVNPNLLGGFVYPKVWTQYTYTVSGLSASTTVNFAFRYYVTNGGPSGANSDIIGLDTFSVDRPAASANQFFASNFSVSPNPASDVITIATKNNIQVNSVQLVDMNGRIVKEMNTSFDNQATMNISEINSGVYFVKVNSQNGVGTSKIIKK